MRCSYDDDDGVQIAARYDQAVEDEVRSWIRELLGVDLRPGVREMEKQLKDGQLLVR